MIGLTQAFSQRYSEARRKFLEASASAGLSMASHNHPLLGLDGEVLAMDVTREGPPDAEKLLIISSACHGVEGYCGSGVQVFALCDEEWRAKAQAQGVAVLYIHALNPYGFSYKSRTTHENVDLNRNFLDFKQPLPVNLPYRELHPLVVPAQWPPTAAIQAALDAYVAQHGEAAFQSACSRGQYEFADGLHYGGKQATWSNQTLNTVLAQHGANAKRIAWIDLHTGLGPNGVGERIFAGPNEPASVARARQWWGSGDNKLTSIYDGTSSSPLLTGLMWNSLPQRYPSAQYTGMAMEYGTLPMLQVNAAIRGDNWLRQHPEAAPALADQIRQQTMDAFFTDTDLWKGQIISQARQSMFQAVDGLAQ